MLLSSISSLVYSESFAVLPAFLGIFLDIFSKQAWKKGFFASLLAIFSISNFFYSLSVFYVKINSCELKTSDMLFFGPFPLLCWKICCENGTSSKDKFFILVMRLGGVLASL
jgi:hypothetical protein